MPFMPGETPVNTSGRGNTGSSL
uniref:Uncharacterized protein n=1 Tax=Anguilla anguilla TaxID=7936 RepID=A0A0E9PNX3_ANGAN